MTPTSPLCTASEATANPAVEGVVTGLGAVLGGETVTGLLVVVDGVDRGEVDAVWLVLPPKKSQAPATSIRAARRGTARQLPLISRCGQSVVQPGSNSTVYVKKLALIPPAR